MKIVEMSVLDIVISMVRHSRFTVRVKEDLVHLKGNSNCPPYRGPTLLRSKCFDAPLVYIKRK